MIYAFDSYELDTDVYELRQTGKALKIEPKVFDVLACLLRNRANVVSKEALLDEVWPEQYITEATLSSCIMAARKAVGDSGRTQRVIQTIHGRGYRFIAPVDERSGQAAPQGSPESSSPSWPCGTCRHPNTPEATFCAACGARLQQPCPNCKRAVPLPATYCPSCGHGLEPASPSSPLVRPHPERLLSRESALRVLMECLQRLEQAQGQTVALVGDSGLGKSRLLDAWRDRVPSGKATYLSATCQPIGQSTPYLPLRTVVRQLGGLAASDASDVMTTKLSSLVRKLGLAPDGIVPCLMRLLGVVAAPEERLETIFEMTGTQVLTALRQTLVAQSRLRPLIIAIDDLEWADQTSQLCLAALADVLPTAPILLILAVPPGYRPAWFDDLGIAELTLSPFTVPESRRMIHALLPHQTLPEPLARTIVARASGNPLFLSELTRAVAEQDRIEPDTPLPSTLREVLSRRLQHMPGSQQRLLQTASVLGPHFALRLLEAVWDGPEDAQTLLLDLERQAWCHALPDSSDLLYTFRHPLFHEVVYQSLPPARRQRLHALVGHQLEARGGDQRQKVYELLAYHYGQAGERAKTVEYARLAARKCFAYDTPAEALLTVQHALSCLQHRPSEPWPQRHLELVLMQAQALTALGRFADALTHLGQFEPQLVQLHEAGLTSRYMLLLSEISGHLGAWEQAAVRAEQALKMALSCHADPVLGPAHQMVAMTAYWAGNPLLGSVHCQHAITCFEPSAQRSRLAMTQSLLGLHRLLLGDFTGALAALTQARELAREMGDASLLAQATWITGWVQATRGAGQEAIRTCQEALTISSDPLNSAFARGCLGYAYLEQGEGVAAIPLLTQAADLLAQYAYTRHQGLFTVFLGEAYLLRPDLVTASTLGQRGLELAEATGYRFANAWARRLLGRIADSSGKWQEAAELLQIALDEFAALPARFELARTHLQLAKLYHGRSNREAACRHATEAERLFTTLRMPAYQERLKPYLDQTV
jgi:DNA-binding winged helix-turn-helix (wHTH) protein/tetratricopeptide (TPR) repeat protein